LKLLVAFEYSSLNGGELSWLAIAPYLQTDGLEICAWAPAQGPMSEALDEHNVVLLSSALSNQHAVRLPQHQLREALAADLRRYQPQLLHTNSLSMSRLLGPVTDELGVPSIGHLRDIVRLSRQAIVDINRHRRLLAVSAATRHYHLDQGLDCGKTHVLYNGVDLNRMRPARANGFLHRELQLPSTAVLMTSIGQIGMRKGLDVTLDALKVIMSSREDVHWLVVGQRNSQKDEAIHYADQLRGRSAQPPYVGRVHWLGRRTDVADVLRESTLVVHAARQEPLGRVLLEAAAIGTAVVATDVGGTREIFGDPGAGSGAALVPADDAEQLARTISALLSDVRQRRDLATAARRRAERFFGAARSADGLLSHYKATIAD
jgi:glycosyltransferase involved in cell wall biosynthesis